MATVARKRKEKKQVTTTAMPVLRAKRKAERSRQVNVVNQVHVAHERMETAARRKEATNRTLLRMTAGTQRSNRKNVDHEEAQVAHRVKQVAARKPRQKRNAIAMKRMLIPAKANDVERRNAKEDVVDEEMVEVKAEKSDLL